MFIPWNIVQQNAHIVTCVLNVHQTPEAEEDLLFSHSPNKHFLSNCSMSGIVLGTKEQNRPYHHETKTRIERQTYKLNF